MKRRIGQPKNNSRKEVTGGQKISRVNSNGHPTQNSALGRSPAQALLNTGARPIPRIGPHRSQIIVRLLLVA
jgi:hypothetical protein